MARAVLAYHDKQTQPGRHHVFQHPRRPGRLTVAHPKKDLGKGLAHKIRKQAGLK